METRYFFSHRGFSFDGPYLCKFVERQAHPALMVPDYEYDEEDILETMPGSFGTLTRFRFWLIIKSNYFHENILTSLPHIFKILSFHRKIQQDLKC